MPDSPCKFYLTTPIYYVNARPHIGHAYTTIVADVLARRHRLLGPEQNRDTFFLTGTDEHGQKIERSAAAAGIPPQQFADKVSASFEDLWTRMGITNNAFIRTSDPRHKRGAQKLFRTLYDRGQIYLSAYTGQYCVSEEMFVEGPPGTIGPDGRPTETVTEENFFFRLSDFQLPLLDLIEDGPNGEPPQLRITPEARRNEVLSFLRGRVVAVEGLNEIPIPSPEELGLTDKEVDIGMKSGLFSRSAAGIPYYPGALKDISVSRSSFTWGIPVPTDIQAAAGVKEPHVIYVWLDALANYMTAIGFGSDAPEDQAQFEKFWPADLHLVGKEIIRFHCVYWPAFLLALNPKLAFPEKNPPTGTPAPKISPEEHRDWAKNWLPKAITAHGWLLFDNSKMSKSKGNIVRSEAILDAFGQHVYAKQFPDSTKHDQDLFATDVLRYFLLREIPFGQDGTFSFDAMWDRYNADLTNGYGNLVKRTLSMLEMYSSGSILAEDRSDWDEELWKSYALSKSPGVTQWSAPSEIDPTPSREYSMYHVLEHATRTRELLKGKYGNVGFQAQLAEIFLTIRMTDGFISSETPWKLAKQPELRSWLNEVLYTAAESIRIITALLYPILPFSTAKVWAQLGLGDIEQAAGRGDLNNLQWGGLQPGTKLGPLTPIFPRADKGLAQIMVDTESNSTPGLPVVNNTVDAATSEATEFIQTPLADAVQPTLLSPKATDGPYPNETPFPSRLSGETTNTAPATQRSTTAPDAGPRSLAEPNPIAQVAGAAAPMPDLPRTPSHTEAHASGPFAAQASAQPITTTSENATQASPQITIDDFAKVELRVAQILVAERIPKADKLLRLEVDLGPEPGMGRRQILSGIAEWYTPEDLIGRRIVVITNLAPRKMRGLESHGMLLAASASDNGKPILATMAEDIALGSRLK